MLNDDYCKELTHPHLYGNGKFTCKFGGDIPLTPSKYFNPRELNYTFQFLSDSDHIFFLYSVVQHLTLNILNNISVQKLTPNNIIALQTRLVRTSMKQFIAWDDAFSFINIIKRTQANLKKCLKEFLEMVKQLDPCNIFWHYLLLNKNGMSW